ncbi:MAG: phenol hydroxylase [Kordiimonas sp.]|nr:phenol hydroxylase [Kordiimonas sp.]|tara:strand:+ start:5546 stop:5809 length:264 start_codon:yes stop_codon:yes gene_type:complete
MSQGFQSAQDRLSDYDKTIVVTGVRRNLYVEFDFTVGEEILTVELVMPFPAFEEFCALNNARITEIKSDIEKDFEQLKWRHQKPSRD